MNKRYLTITIPCFDGYKTLCFNAMVMLFGCLCIAYSLVYGELFYLEPVHALALVLFALVNIALRVVTERPVLDPPRPAPDPAADPHRVGANRGLSLGPLTAPIQKSSENSDFSEKNNFPAEKNKNSVFPPFPGNAEEAEKFFVFFPSALNTADAMNGRTHLRASELPTTDDLPEADFYERWR